MQSTTLPRIFLSSALTLAASVTAAGSMFEGDVKYACEALLCLSSGERPHECDGALERYYDIDYEDPRETAEKRREFLELCPDQESEETESFIAGIKEESGIVEEPEEEPPLTGCTAAYINKHAQIKTELGLVVHDQPPSGCRIYSEGVVPPVYIGEMGWGGFWAEKSTEERAWERYYHYVPNWARKRELLGIMPIWPPGWE
ncbi:MAG: TrbM/KikA/MpfK family conjugal transfer protein [Parahaliea sp.]